MVAIVGLIARCRIPGIWRQLWFDIREALRIELWSYAQFPLSQIIAGEGIHHRREQQNRRQVGNGHTGHDHVGELPYQRKTEKRTGDDHANRRKT